MLVVLLLSLACSSITVKILTNVILIFHSFIPFLRSIFYLKKI